MPDVFETWRAFFAQKCSPTEKTKPVSAFRAFPEKQNTK
jgi:hypothetical protein